MSAATAAANLASARNNARRAAERIEDLTTIADGGGTLDEACARLGLDRDNLWVFCKRRSVLDLYETLAARQRRTGNQYRRLA